MKALILAAAATLFMAGAVSAADDASMKKMTAEECTAAMAACTDDACKQKLKDNNGCEMPAAQ